MRSELGGKLVKNWLNWMLTFALCGAFVVFLGCAGDVADDDVADDDVADDDASDDDTSDGDAADDDAADDDVADDDAADDDVADDDAGDDDTGVDPVAMEDLVYLLDFAGGTFNFTEPAGIGTVLSLFLGQLPEDQGVIYTADEIDDGAGTVHVLISSGSVTNPLDDPSSWVWAQNDGPTTDTNGIWNNPAFVAGPADMTFDAGDATVWMGDVEFGGAYLPDGSSMVDVQLAGNIDTVAFDDMLGQDAGLICATLSGFGIPCVTCPASSPHQGDYCLYVVADSGVCPMLAGLTLVAVP